jgi:hypothetical protein
VCFCREGFGQGILVLEHSGPHAVKFFKVTEGVWGYGKGVPDPTYDCSRIKFSGHALRHGGPVESSYPVGYLSAGGCYLMGPVKVEGEGNSQVLKWLCGLHDARLLPIQA